MLIEQTAVAAAATKDGASGEGAALVPAAGQPGAADGTKLPSRYGGLTAAGRTQHWAPLDAAPGVRLTPLPRLLLPGGLGMADTCAGADNGIDHDKN
jgi:hypothetical protein